MKKPFNQVKIGDISTDYSGDTWKVKDKGTAAEMFRKYSGDTSMSLVDFMENKEFDETLTSQEINCIVEYNPGIEGNYVIYGYGYMGAWVTKPFSKTLRDLAVVQSKLDQVLAGIPNDSLILGDVLHIKTNLTELMERVKELRDEK